MEKKLIEKSRECHNHKPQSRQSNALPPHFDTHHQSCMDLLFITGGVFGLMDGRMNDTLKNHGSKSNSITMWPDKNPVLISIW